MATWLAHLRVAELILEEFHFPEEDFLVGNIAPDCGEPVPGGFDPPKEVTHWTVTGSKGGCDYERFRRELIAGRELGPHTRALLIGYFCHLMADVLWVKLINEPCKALNHELYSSDREEYYRRVKPEWYANDHLFLLKNPGDEAFRKLCAIAEYPVECIPYYKPDNVEKQLHHIQRFYLEPPEYSAEFTYLTPAMMDAWVREASEIIMRRLGEGV